jgi:hypothetical protein
MAIHPVPLEFRVHVVVGGRVQQASTAGSFWADRMRLPPPGGVARSDAGDVGGEEVDAVAVEVAAGAVVVFGGAGVGVAGEDLRVAERDAGVEGVGDRGMSQ